MPLDPNIILAGRPALIENPIQAYGRMLSLRNMQQQSAIQQQQANERAAMAPYQQQQQQAAAQEAQIRVQQAQRDQQDQQAMGDAVQALAKAPASGDQTADATAYGYGPDNPVGPANPQTRASAGAAQAAGSPSHPLDLMTALQDAFQNRGMSYNGYLARQKQILADQEQRAKTRSAMSAADLAKSNADDARHNEIARRLVAFTDNTPEYQEANWKNFNQQLLTDEKYTEPEYSAVVAQHPDLPDPQTLQNYILHFRSNAGQNQAADLLTKQAQQTAAKSQEKLRAAQLPGAQAKTEQETRANWGGQLAAQTTQEGFDDVINRMPDDLAKQVNLLTDGEFDPDQTPSIIQKWSQTPEQQVTSAATAASRAETTAHQRTMEAQGWQRIAIQKARAGAGGLTPIQTLRETDAISREEFGLHQERIDIGSKLTGGFAVDKNGNPTKIPLNAQQRGQMQGRLQLVNGQLQQVQARKAQMMGMGTAPQSDIDKMTDGQENTQPDGGVWRKQDGIAYPVSKGPPPAAPASAYKVGDVVTVRGKQLRITAIHPNGTFDGDPL